MSDLEKKLIQDIKADKNISLERGLLILSGLKTDREIGEYTRRLDQIHNNFIATLKIKSPLSLSASRKYMVSSVAKLLFEYLWNTKPRRCNSNFLLTDVIDAQLNPDIEQKVGSCVGLTALYTVLGLRERLNLSILVSDSHIVNKLRVNESMYHIDNTDPLGFDCNLEKKYFVEYPSVSLLANVLNSRGIEKERVEDWEKAKEDYHKAIQINPGYANAHNNRGNIRSRQTDYTGAIKDYNRALELNSYFVEAHCNRGIARENLGDYAGAIKDFDRATEINSEYIDAYLRRGIVKQNLGDYAGAIKDFDKALELEPESKDEIVPFRACAERLLYDLKA